MIDRTEVINSLEREIKRIRKEPKRKMLGIFMTADEAEGIVTLLKEQEPAKPVVNQDEWVCGCCGSWLERQRMIHPGAILHDLCEYCPSCGKKVDWKAVDPDANEV